jgi:hypothetical protein
MILLAKLVEGRMTTTYILLITESVLAGWLTAGWSFREIPGSGIFFQGGVEEFHQDYYAVLIAAPSSRETSARP